MSSNVWPPLTSQGMNKMLGHQAPESVSWFVTLQLLMRDHHKWHRRTVRCYIHPLDTDSSRRQSNEICLHLSSQSCVAFFLPRIVAIPLSIRPNKTVLPLESRKGGKTTVKQKIARQRERIRDTVTKVITLFLSHSLSVFISMTSDTSQWVCRSSWYNSMTDGLSTSWLPCSHNDICRETGDSWPLTPQLRLH